LRSWVVVGVSGFVLCGSCCQVGAYRENKSPATSAGARAGAAGSEKGFAEKQGTMNKGGGGGHGSKKRTNKEKHKFLQTLPPPSPPPPPPPPPQPQPTTHLALSKLVVLTLVVGRAKRRV
jgi:hypothetical protein